MQRIIGGKRYNTDTATCIADDYYWDGHNFERHGRNCYLYRTPNGAYFFHTTSLWQGEAANITPCSEDEAREYYENSREQNVPFERAFPSVVVVDA
jgi:hypothetical protein